MGQEQAAHAIGSSAGHGRMKALEGRTTERKRLRSTRKSYSGRQMTPLERDNLRRVTTTLQVHLMDDQWFDSCNLVKSRL